MLYISSILCFLLIFRLFKYNRRFAIFNLVIFIFYNLILHYNLFYNADGGSSFIWWFYLGMTILIQIAIVGFYLVRENLKTKK